ncbi:MFS family major facilitator transporter [Piromyces finnis]|uniref:MFS family major facilitator transporter n=1 Tax=Piromyces finnis TaxID=1754191 RepID=A0A1Y1VF27_9FUNG|nr:MFS family major facilitator transporter [Piromyces finnis]|eukprot:ORX53802.1 MFS family major facilitator transporter [Piromyces finnis]
MLEELKISDGVKVSYHRAIAIFINLNISCLATTMLSTALTTTLPPIMKEFQISVNSAQWLTSGFELFLSIFTPMTAYLISKFKTKKLYLSAITFFIVGLTICAASQNFPVMMVGRVIQGCGNGLLNAMAQIIILAIFPKEKVGLMNGIYGISIGVSPVIAPAIAGILIDLVGWRAIFIGAIIIMTISLIWAFIVFQDVLPTMRRDFDFISLFICILAFGGVTLSISNYGVYSFTSCQVLIPLAIGLASSFLFVWRQLRIDIPFLDVRVLKDKNLAVSTILTFILELILMGSIMLCPIYVQEVKKLSATISGFVLIPGALAMAAMSPIAGVIYDKIGIRHLALVGSFISAVINIILFYFPYHQSVWLMSGLNVFKCATFGLHLMPFLSWGMKNIPILKASDANALFISFRCLGCSLGTALFVAIYSKVAKHYEYQKEYPEMYGINVSFLIMGLLAILMFFISLWGCKSNRHHK